MTDAPENYKSLFESLDEGQQKAIRSQAKVYRLDTAYQIKNFWETRPLTPKVELETLNESESAKIDPTNNLGYASGYLDNVAKSLEGRKF